MVTICWYIIRAFNEPPMPTLSGLVLCEYSIFQIESNSYSSIRFNSKSAQLFEIFEYLVTNFVFISLNNADFSPKQPCLETNMESLYWCIMAHQVLKLLTETTIVRCHKTVEFI